MAWTPPPPAAPPVGWWVERENQRLLEAGLDRARERIADGARAERIERLRARCHELDMRCAGALSADRWRKIQRRHDQRFVRSYGGQLVDSWGAGPEVEYSTHDGRVLSVR